MGKIIAVPMNCAGAACKTGTGASGNPHPLNPGGEIGFKFSFAFQPIVDVRNREIISFEALVRGPHGEPSASVFAQVPSRNFIHFDDICRQKAILLASRLKIPNQLNLNLHTSSIYEVDQNITATFKASKQSGIPVENIVFEVLETANLTDHRNLSNTCESSRISVLKPPLMILGWVILV